MYITDELIDMLSYRRPAWSKSEEEFIDIYIDSLEQNVTEVIRDGFGNRIIAVGDPEILWSCHTDSVHRLAGRQQIKVLDGIVSIKDKHSNCLGADDAVGVWIMRHMIKAEIPGLYIFHRAEEIGGQGSDYLATNYTEMLSYMKAAIAFDRRAEHSIITHQWLGRTCSNVFAESLAYELAMKHISDPTGSFTDTANYAMIIGECTNISVGYDMEHTRWETTDLDYAMELLEALLSANFRNLEYDREPELNDEDDEDVAWWDEYEDRKRQADIDADDEDDYTDVSYIRTR